MKSADVAWAVCLVLLGFAQCGTCQQQTIAQLLADSPDEFSTLVGALEAAGLVDTFSGEGNFTVFAPTNTAFGDFLEANDGLPEGALLNNTALLTTYLNYHVLGSKVESGDIANGAVVATLGGLSVGFDTTDGVKIVHGTTPKATVTQADIQASNGVVHVIVIKFQT